MLRFINVLSLITFVISNSSWAANYYVNDLDLTGDIYTSSPGNNSNNGTSLNTPKATLTDLLATYSGSFAPGDTLFIDAGTYYITDANLTIGTSLNGVTIMGAGSTVTFFDNDGTSTDANRWANITGANVNLQGIYLTGYNYGLGGASTLNISGATNLKITDVEINENSSGGGASAIMITGGSTVDFIGGGSNCNPIGPSVAGGGINIEGNGNVVSFTNYSLTGNVKSLQGGSGIYIFGDNTTFVTISNSTISNNTNTSSQGGAGIYLSGANLTISGSCIEGNSTNSGSGPKYGGGITLARGATLTATNCNFANNTVLNSGKGGAVSINTSFSGNGSTATASFTSCNFDGNTASSEGNHIYLRVGSGNGANVIVDECTFSTTSQDLRQDNSGTVSVTNSGTSLTLSGSNITNNNANPLTTATSFCPPSSTSCFSILPVELIEFYSVCEYESPTIHWTTASEVNNDYFILERVNFDGTITTIAKVNGSGNSQSEITYAYSDKQAPAGINYYRLTQVDFDGKREVFNVISSQNCSKQPKTTVHFSEESQQLVFSNFNRNIHTLIEVTVISMVGNTLLTEQVSVVNQSKGIVSLTDLMPFGNYLIVLKFTDHEEIARLLVY